MPPNKVEVPSGPTVARMRVLWALAALAGIALMCVPYATSVGAILKGHNDFAALYSSARLVGTPHLYDADSLLRLKAEATGERSSARLNIRLPYWAAFLWPLGRLSFPAAYWTFQGISLAVLAAALLLWPGDRKSMLMACCWSAPVAATLAMGQDVLFLVLWVTLALRWAERSPFWAGLAFALCASKFHLFLHIPVLLAARRQGRMAAGLGTGGAVLALVSFAVAGADWPLRFLATISSPVVSPGEDTMPNLHNLLSGVPGRAGWEIAMGLACAAMVWVAARRTNFRVGLAAALMAGLLTSVHAYPQDAALLIPAAFLLLATGVGWLRMAALALLVPVWYLLLIIGAPAGRFLPGALFVLLAALAWEAVRSGCTAPGADAAAAGSR